MLICELLQFIIICVTRDFLNEREGLEEKEERRKLNFNDVEVLKSITEVSRVLASTHSSSSK